MLTRLLIRPSSLRFVALNSSYQSHHKHHHPSLIQSPCSSSFFSSISRFFSTNNNNGSKSSDLWKISTENEESIESVFGEVTKSLEDFVGGGDAVKNHKEEESWFSSEWKEKGGGNDVEHDIFKVIESEGKRTEASRVNDKWGTGEGFTDWKFGVGDQKDGGEAEIFDIGDAGVSESAGLDGDVKLESQNKEEDRFLEIEEKALSEVLKGGPDHAFGDLIAASGITDEMLESLMALKDLDDVPGLPPLSEIEEMRYEKNTSKSTRADIERQKQEEITKSRVRQVDSQGRAYGTGKRKCSIARVWVEPGDGKFVINDKQFDVYFPMLDQRAALLRPLSETKTLGLLNVNCTVKGGGVSGQIGAIRLGMSRALQNWAPDQFRPPLKQAGFLTRDSRVVERKKPGKAKARKSFQWVKR
ncbi:30S ribosomal protein S9, mitochondrial [Cynara cardunculus var. scolymus]|uniref:30S ribosomal protein S9, mitochondrial n=1 Tax=Cynara cardunculus var. scolymus TaxID=59895 RepID=UPI000D62E9BA|nr:30S ribosomal protein S9, mitochondrial [Cynara cardunculus var. scolymus]XP_024962895.1 30S ribosomal protein S9, mitochondrial [Cynara cardunculus var. scolymus]